MKELTVGDLIEKLQKINKDIPVVIKHPRYDYIRTVDLYGCTGIIISEQEVKDNGEMVLREKELDPDVNSKLVAILNY